jgi:hypothetical protein
MSITRSQLEFRLARLIASHSSEASRLAGQIKLDLVYLSESDQRRLDSWHR